MPLGVLFRGNAEAEIRKSIIDRGSIKGIIGLPANLFYGTGIAASIIIINKEDAEHRKGIFMIDASKGFIKDGNKNRLREQDIRKIVDVFTQQLAIPKYSRMVPLSEIRDPKNNYNLNIPRYIDSQEEEDTQNIEAHLKGGIPDKDIEGLNKYWTVYPNLKTSLFKENEREGFWDLKIPKDEIKKSIFNHPEFIRFSDEMDKVFEKWQTKNTTYLKGLEKACLPKKVIKEISEDLLKTYANKYLIDKYNIYQHLMDYWAETMQDDLYELAADGWEAETIAALYKKRWDIKLFFKSMKQNLQIKSFLGTNENAVKSQIYIALICYLLLQLLKRTVATKTVAFSNFVERIRTCLPFYLSLINYVCNHISEGARRVKRPPPLELFPKYDLFSAG